MTRKGDQTRERILVEAARLFQKQGFQTTSLSDILAATNLKKGALYFHFANKNEIALAALERARIELSSFLDNALSSPNPQEALNRYFSSLLNWQQEKGLVGGCIFGNTALEMGDTDERFASFVAAVFEDWIIRLRNVVEEAQLAGIVRNDISADSLARHMVAVTEGAIMLDRLNKNNRALSESFNNLKLFLFLDSK
ncbi:TetR/AcrR family transcriptional regulator [Halodesulfovibrio marinisediminis]|uniref:Transcriptional regulator, TetR family n=1 Tax=Halodesulfovibrio marinisediminis DSM 17456 TaxID=1121457 RepID=A0A1N6DXG3_9BACT|nr:TetR/AcrR family transcriptional regulator [Halodesulfovibrio marinisediminis]SIN75469.1 transcriptional regulator, TetR family [Halodesulfovibrio marinisediminis DSM 17456]